MTTREQSSVRLLVRTKFDHIEISSKPFPTREDAEAHLAENPPDDDFEADIHAVGNEPTEGDFH